MFLTSIVWLRILIVVILSVFGQGVVIAQYKADTTAIVLNAKIKAIAESSIYPEHEKELHGLIKQTNYKFLSQNGFTDVLFIKIKLRERNLMKHFLFMQTLSDDEKTRYLLNPDATFFDSLKQARLWTKYKVNDSSGNDQIEQNIDSNSNYFYNIGQSIDCYIACVFDEVSYKLMLIATVPSLNKSDCKEFNSLLKSKSILDAEVKYRLDDKAINAQNFESIKDYLFVEEIDLLKFVEK